MKKRLQNIRQLLKVLYQYQTIERAFPTPYSTRLENDVEHSYMLTMLAWYIIEEERLPLDHEKVLKYCLAHDLVEVYAGDTWTVGTKSAKRIATKEKREDKAQQRLKNTLPDFKELHRYIEGYKLRSEPESQFVWALDKIISNLTVSLHADKGKRTFKKMNVTLVHLYDSKKDKVAVHPTTAALWEALTDLLKEYDRKYRIFPKPTSVKKLSRRNRR